MTRTFPKEERLSGRKAVHKVFTEGDQVFKYPLQIKFIANPGQSTNRFLVSVPKRLFKRAVDRNLLKRRIREAYRLNKEKVTGNNYDIACTYIGKETAPYSTIEQKLSHLLQRLK